MIERIIEFSIRRPWRVLVATLVVALAGLGALVDTPVDAIPDLSENQVIVFTPWEGHGPHEIDDQITSPLSFHLQGTPQIRVVRGSSDANFSLIHVIFDDAVPIDAARREVAQRLAGASSVLPPGVEPTLAPESPATGQIYWYTVEGSGLDLGQLYEINDSLVRPQLTTVPGVAEVALVGGFAAEYDVEVDAARLQFHGISMSHLTDAIAAANATTAGGVLQKAGAEYLVRASTQLGSELASQEVQAVSTQVIHDLENVLVPLPNSSSCRLGDVARIALGPQPRRGVFEKDGNEVTGGVISMRYGENPLDVTARIKAKIDNLQESLPVGVRIVTVYDRTPLIHGAIKTVTRTLIEAVIAASLCVFVVFRRFGVSLVVVFTLPLAVLASFLTLWVGRRLGLFDVQTNIMTLAGLAVSIGILVDAGIVMAENAVHALHERFQDQPVRGDVRTTLLPACRTVGRPIFFSILIMLLSFFPVFVLEGAAGKMFRPLAFMKSAALVAAAIAAITVVPACCTLAVRGRMRSERESWIVRSVMDVYRPMLDYLLSNPMALAWVLGATLLAASAALGSRLMFLGLLLAAIIAVGMLARARSTRAFGLVSIIVVALLTDRFMPRLRHELMTPLDEGMVMDMPITVPRASISQTLDDLKARDMVLCRFPEVAMVVGKGGRADTPTDPAPLDMIETMVEFRPDRWWPRRKLSAADARRESSAILNDLVGRGFVAAPEDDAAARVAADLAADDSLVLFDQQMREYACQRNLEFMRDLGSQLQRHAVEQCLSMMESNDALLRPIAPGDATLICAKAPPELAIAFQTGATPFATTLVMRHVAAESARLQLLNSSVNAFSPREDALIQAVDRARRLLGIAIPTFRTRLQAAVASLHDELWLAHVKSLDDELLGRASLTFVRICLEHHLRNQRVLEPRLGDAIRIIDEWRRRPPPTSRQTAEHVHGGVAIPPPVHDAQPLLDKLQEDLSLAMNERLWLWKAKREELTGFDGELDRAVQMPGWTNVWTMPIQNRVDMLATGVNTTVGVCVLGRKLDDVVAAANQVGELVKAVPGAAQVIVDPIRGKGYLDVDIDREKLARFGVTSRDVNLTVEAALGGSTATITTEGRVRRPVRIRLFAADRRDEQAIARLPLAGSKNSAEGDSRSSSLYFTLADVADVHTSEGPAVIKSENGLLRTYVRCNVVGRGALDFVAEARRVVADAQLPSGVHVEWTGQFQSEARAQTRLAILLPLVIVLIGMILWATYHDVADAALMLLAVPGAMAGGILFQVLCGYQFTITVWIGYIACFGMASATAIIMLVYLRESLAKAGGLANITLAQLREAVLDGAVHRLRPKLLTEATTIIGLAPMLWSTGPGADVIRPMAAPVLGGILVADEVIDLLIPVLFHWVRRRRWQRLHLRKFIETSATALPLRQKVHELSAAT